MSLRDALRQAVARCAPQPTQRATSTVLRAHARATTAQQQTANPHGCELDGATGSATTAQPARCATPQNDAPFVARVAQAGNPLLTAEQADACHAGGWNDTEIQTFTTRVLVLMRRGFNAADADDLAERLALRDREHDDRGSCIECRHYLPGRCGNHRRAQLHAPEVGRDLAMMLQHCSGFAEAPQ